MSLSLGSKLITPDAQDVRPSGRHLIPVGAIAIVDALEQYYNVSSAGISVVSDGSGGYTTTNSEDLWSTASQTTWIRVGDGGGANYTGADNTIPLSNGLNAASGFDASIVTQTGTASISVAGDIISSGNISGGTGDTSLGKNATKTKIFGTGLTPGAGTSFNFLAALSDNTIDTAPSLCSTGSGSLEILNYGLTIDTTTTGSHAADRKLIDFNLGTADAEFKVTDGTNNIISTTRTSGGNAVAIGASGTNASLTVNGNLTLANETTAGFLINNSSGLVDSTTNGSTLTDVNALTINDNGSSSAPLKLWTGTLLQYQALSPASDTIYNVTDNNTPGAITYGGPVTMSSTLTVGNAASLNGGTSTTTLATSGLASLNGGASVTGNATVSGVSTLTGGIAPNGTTTVPGIKFWAGTRSEFQTLFNSLNGVLDANTIYNYPGVQITSTT